MKIGLLSRVLRLILSVAFVGVLSGCVIESKTSLHSDAQKIPIHTLMVAQSATFRSKAGDYVFLRRAQGQMTVTLTKFSGAIGKNKTFSTALYQMQGLPKSVYVAVRSGEGRHEYLPFHYDKKGLLILSPRKRVQVTTMEEFQQALLNVQGKPIFYERLGLTEGAAAYKRYVKREAQRKAANKRRAHEYVNPYRVFDTGIDRFSEGDQVYWLRAMTTEVMTVSKINISTGYLILRRETDFVTAKVHHSHLMTSKQASENGIKHGVATTRSAYCLSQPKQCHW